MATKVPCLTPSLQHNYGPSVCGRLPDTYRRDQALYEERRQRKSLESAKAALARQGSCQERAAHSDHFGVPRVEPVEQSELIGMLLECHWTV